MSSFGLLIYETCASGGGVRAFRTNRFRNLGRYFSVLNWDSAYGLSFETCGREWDLVIPRSPRSKATGLDSGKVATSIKE